MSADDRRPRSMGDGPFGWYTKAAHTRAIEAAGGIGGAIYIGLTKRQSDAGSKGKLEFYASIQNVATACGLSVRTVAKHIPLLERAGLLRHISGRHGGEDGAHCANRWVLIGFQAPAPTGLVRVAHKGKRQTHKLVHPSPDSNANREGISRSTDRERTSKTPAASAVPMGPAGRGVPKPVIDDRTPEQKAAYEANRLERQRLYDGDYKIISALMTREKPAETGGC